MSHGISFYIYLCELIKLFSSEKFLEIALLKQSMHILKSFETFSPKDIITVHTQPCKIILISWCADHHWLLLIFFT